MKEKIHLKRQYVRVVETVKRESYTLENKVLLSEFKKYKIEKDSDAIFVFKIDTG